MATAIFGSPLQAVEGETVTLSTTAQGVGVKAGFHEIKVYCASQWRLALSPRLYQAYFYLNSGTSYTSYLSNVTDKTSTTHMPLDAMTSSDIAYFATNAEVRGFYFSIDGTNKNSNAATLDWEYYSSSGWTDVAGDSDGTDTTGATMNVSGIYTFTLPASTITEVNSIGGLYWYRFKPSATLSNTVDIIEIVPLYKNANYGYMEGGTEYQFSLNADKVGGFEVAATSGTPTLDLTWIKH